MLVHSYITPQSSVVGVVQETICWQSQTSAWHVLNTTVCVPTEVSTAELETAHTPKIKFMLPEAEHSL
jgi:hypothetical protein